MQTTPEIVADDGVSDLTIVGSSAGSRPQEGGVVMHDGAVIESGVVSATAFEVGDIADQKAVVEGDKEGASAGIGRVICHDAVDDSRLGGVGNSATCAV